MTTEAIPEASKKTSPSPCGGSVVPSRDGKEHKRVRCIYPFHRYNIYEGTKLIPCCDVWFKKGLGNLLEDDLETVWNNDIIQEVRKEMYEGGNPEKFCNADTCPVYKSGKWYDLDENPSQIQEELIDEVRQGKTELENGPLFLELGNDFKCNYKCVMCTSWKKEEVPGGNAEETIKKFEGRWDKIHNILMLSSGEVFTRPKLLDYLEEFESEKYPNLQFSFITNGSMINEARWKRISHLNIDSVNISIDAADADTYSKIRVNGKWDNLLDNIRFLVARQKEGELKRLYLNMTVMSSNHDQISKFAHIFLGLGASHVYFQWLHSMRLSSESIFDNYLWNDMEKIVEQLNDPILMDPRVDASAIFDWWKWIPEKIGHPVSVADAREKVQRSMILKMARAITGNYHEEVILDCWNDWINQHGLSPESIIDWCKYIQEPEGMRFSKGYFQKHAIRLRRKLTGQKFIPNQRRFQEDIVIEYYRGLINREGDITESDAGHWREKLVKNGHESVLDEFLKNTEFYRTRISAFVDGIANDADGKPVAKPTI